MNCFGRFSNTFASKGSPIFLPKISSVFSRKTSFVLKTVFSHTWFRQVGGSRRGLKPWEWACSHSSRITNLLECMFTLEHCICT